MYLKTGLAAVATAHALAAPVKNAGAETHIKFTNGTTQAKLGNQVTTFKLFTDINLIEAPRGKIESVVNGQYAADKSGSAKDTGTKQELIFNPFSIAPSNHTSELYTDTLEIAGKTFTKYPVYVGTDPLGGSELDLSPKSSLVKAAGGQTQFNVTLDYYHNQWGMRQEGTSNVHVTFGSFGTPGTFHKFNSTNAQTIDNITLSFNGTTSKPFTAALDFSKSVSVLPRSALNEFGFGEEIPCNVTGNLDIGFSKQTLSFDRSSYILSILDPTDRDICRSRFFFDAALGATPTLGQNFLEKLLVTYDTDKEGVWIMPKG